MKKDWVLTQEAFDSFLRWLSPDRDEAALKYEEIRRKLLNFFDFKGCEDAETLVDETINRVTERIFRATPDEADFPVQFVYGVARKIHLESYSAPKIYTLNEELPLDASVSETEFFGDDARDCMQICLKELKEADSKLVFAYFGVSKKNKLEEREALSKDNGESINALRVRISRIRQKLQKCQKNCLNGKKTM